MELAKTRTRRPELDLMRCFAMYLVVAVHSLLNMDFYQVNTSGGAMYLLTLMRSFGMICVPLFMVLSGYLEAEKRPELRYYKKIGRILVLYVLAAACCTLYRNLGLREGKDFLDFLVLLCNYEACPYGWYVEMYLGLFLLIPMLNALYKGLETRKNKQILLLTLFILCSLPGIVNIYYPNPEWILHPSLSYDFYQIMPDWWGRMYPLLYYFLGSYLREYGFHMKRGKNLLCILAVALIHGTFCFYRSDGGLFLDGAWAVHSGPAQVLQTVLVFGLILNLDCSRLPSGIQRWLARLSDLCFGAYLISWVFDRMVYPRLMELVPQFRVRMLLAGPFAVILVLALSLGASWVLNRCCDLLLPRKKA